MGWGGVRHGATADRRQKQLQRGAGISAVQQRGAAVQQHAGAGGRTLCLLVVCAMTAERIGDLLFNRRPPNESWAKDFRSARLVCAAAWSLAVRRFLRAQVDAAMQRRRLPFGARPLVATGEGLNASPLTALRFGDTLPTPRSSFGTHTQTDSNITVHTAPPGRVSGQTDRQINCPRRPPRSNFGKDRTTQ